MTALAFIALSSLLSALGIVCASWAGVHVYGLTPKVARAGMLAGTVLASYSVPLFYGARLVAQIQQGTLYLFIILVAALAITTLRSWIPTFCAWRVQQYRQRIAWQHSGRHIAT